MLVTDFLEQYDVVEHHGVKGMHWGVRKSRAERANGLIKQAEHHEEASKVHSEIAFKAVHHYDEVVNKGAKSRAFKAAYGANAHKMSDAEFRAKHDITKDQALARTKSDLIKINNAYGNSAINHTSSSAYLRRKAARLQHGDLDDAGEALEHHGIKGMKWGEHHARRQARADANEFAKARAFYGQGAGTRRKLIKAKVQTRMSNQHYKAEFHRTLNGQNVEKRSAQATRLRRRKDTTGFVGKTARGVHRQLSGGFGPVTATAATIAAGATYAHKTGLDKAVIKKIKSAATNKSAQEATKAWLKSQGVG